MGIAVRDIAWLAGLWEGEGYFAFRKASLFMVIDSTDRDVIARTARLMGRRMYGPYANGTNPRTGCPHKAKYRVQLSGAKAAAWMMTLYAELGERRRQSIKACLASWRQALPWRGDRRMCLRGHALSGDNVYVNGRGFRSCRTCERARHSLNKLAHASNSTQDDAAFLASETRKVG